MAATDYSLDPYQTEETNLLEAYKKALAKSLRPTPAMDDPSARFYAAYDKEGADREMDDIQTRRTMLSQQMMSALPDALRGDTATKLAHPMTRNLEQDKLKELQAMQLDDQDRAARAARRASGGQALPGAVAASGGGDNGMSEALDDMRSVRPRVAKSGHELAQLGMPRGNNASVGLNLNTGGFDVVPAGVQSAQQVDYAKSMNELTDWFNPQTQRTEKRPRWFVEQQQGIGAPPGMNQPGMPASSPRALPSATGAAPPPNVPVSDPNMPVSGPSPGVGGAPPGGFEPVPSELQMQRDEQALVILADEAKRGVPGAAQEFQRRRALLERAKATGAQPKVYPTEASMSGPDRGQFTVPPPGAGTANPQQAAMSTATRESEQKDLLKYLEDTQGVYGARNALDDLDRLNKKPLYSGKASNFAATLGAEAGMLFGQQPSQKYDDTQEYVAKSMSLIAPLATKLGYNPSNFDAQTAMKQIATTDNSPRARAQILESMRKAVEYDIGTRDKVRALVDRGYSVSEAQQMADGAYRYETAKKEAETKRPTQADGEGKALPSAVNAVGGRGATGGWGPEEGKGGFMETLKTIGMLANPIDPLMVGDIGRSAANVPTLPFRPETYEAAGDTLGNMWEGTKQITGAGDPLAFETERARQEARMKDPNYAQGRAFTDITANPYNYIPGKGVIGSVLAATLGGFANPVGTEGGKGENAVFNATVAAPFATAGKLIPTVRMAKKLDEEGQATHLLRQNPDLKPTSNQYNPDSLASSAGRAAGVDKAAYPEQVRQLTKGVMNKAGMDGPITTEKLAANEARLQVERNSVFSKDKKISVKPTDTEELRAAIESVPQVEEVLGKSMALARLYQILKPAKAAAAEAPAAKVKTPAQDKAAAEQRTTATATKRPPYTAEEDFARREAMAEEKPFDPANRPPKGKGAPNLKGPLPEEQALADVSYQHQLAEAEAKSLRPKAKKDPALIADYENAVMRASELKKEVAKADAAFQAVKPKLTVRESVEAAAAGKPRLGASDAPERPKSAPKEAAPVRPYTAADLHQAWLDLGEVSGNPMAVKKVRDLLINVMERDMDPGTVAAFRKMNKEYGITRDLTRMYQGGAGEGTGTSAGYLSVDQLKRMAATHDLSKETNEALQAANRFGVKDPIPQNISSETGYAAIRDVAQGIAGKKLYQLDQLSQKIADPRSSEGRKKLIEMLRAATERVVPSAINTERQ